MRPPTSTSDVSLPPLGPAERAAFVAVLLLYLALSLLVFNQIEEDAFIYFRQVQNLAQGYGFVFNRGGEPVEASSSLLWVFLLLPLWWLPVDLVIGAKLLGIVLGCACLWMVFRLSRREITQPVLHFAPVLLTVGAAPFLMWSQRGLEAPLVALLVLCLAACCGDRRYFRWWPAVGILLLLVRPEGILFLAALLPALGRDRERWRAALPGLLLVGAAGLCLLAARFVYFHDFVPSPFYVKLRTAGDSGVEQIRKYLVHSHVWVLGIPFVLRAWRPGFWTPQRVVLGVLVLVAAGWCALAKDYMAYVRHLVPAMPLLFILFVAALDELLARLPRWRTAAAAAYLAIGFIATLLLSRSADVFAATSGNAVAPYLAAFAASPREFVAATLTKVRDPDDFNYLDLSLPQQARLGTNFQSLVGKFVRANYPPESVVLYDQMGQTPFYAGAAMRFIDTLGLTDRTVGRFYFEQARQHDALLRAYDVLASAAARAAFGEPRRDVSKAQVLDYLFRRDPDLILIHDLVATLDPSGIPAALLNDARLEQGYELRHRLARFIRVYERRGSPHRQEPVVPLGLFVTPVP